jgi:hypothetical protein
MMMMMMHAYDDDDDDDDDNDNKNELHFRSLPLIKVVYFKNLFINVYFQINECHSGHVALIFTFLFTLTINLKSGYRNRTF